MSALALLALGLRLPNLDSASLWWDECSTIEMALAVHRSAWMAVTRALFRGLSAYFLLLAPWVGEEIGEWALRLPSVLAGVAFLPVAWRFGEEVGGRGLAWRLGLASALSPFFVWHSREARWYSLTWLLAGLGAICFVRFLKDRGWPALAGCLLFGLAAALTFTPAVTLLVIQVAWITATRAAEKVDPATRLLHPRRFRLARHGVLIALAILASAWLWGALLRPVVRGGSRGFGFTNVGGPTLGAILYSPVALATGYTIGPGPLEWHSRPARPPAPLEGATMVVAVFALLILLLLGFRWMAESGERRLAAALLSLGLGPPVVLVAASLWTDHRFAPRYLGMSFLYLLCLAAAGTLDAGRWKRLGTLLGAGLLILQSASLFNLHFSERYKREDVRSAARYVERAAAPGDQVLVSGGIDLPWKHYYRGRAPWKMVFPEEEGGGSREELQGLARTAGEVFVVRGLILGDLREALLLQALEEVTEPLDRRPFHGVEVTRRRAPPVEPTPP